MPDTGPAARRGDIIKSMSEAQPPLICALLDAGRMYVTTAWWLEVMPGLAIVLVVFFPIWIILVPVSACWKLLVTAIE